MPNQWRSLAPFVRWQQQEFVYPNNVKNMRYDHDGYGKKVLIKAFGRNYQESSSLCTVHYGDGGGTATIDGVIKKKIAVEIESRAPKQVRGAIIDLIMNPLKKKVLLLLPVHMSNIQTTAKQCEYLLSQCIDPKNFCVLILKGTGKKQHKKEDVKFVKDKLRKFL